MLGQARVSGKIPVGLASTPVLDTDVSRTAVIFSNAAGANAGTASQTERPVCNRKRPPGASLDAGIDRAGWAQWSGGNCARSACASRVSRGLARGAQGARSAVR